MCPAASHKVLSIHVTTQVSLIAGAQPPPSENINTQIKYQYIQKLKKNKAPRTLHLHSDD